VNQEESEQAEVDGTKKGVTLSRSRNRHLLTEPLTPTTTWQENPSYYWPSSTCIGWSSDGWAKTSWAKDVWANYFLGDRRLGDKLGRYGDSKSDGWATFSDGWAKCVKEEKLKTSDTIKRQMCARM